MKARTHTLVFLLLATFTLAQENTYCTSMSGVVTDTKTRTWIAGAKISIVGGVATHDAVSDASGKFILELSAHLKCGQNVELSVSKVGYAPSQTWVTVSSVNPLIVALQSTIKSKASPKTAKAGNKTLPKGPATKAGISATASATRTPSTRSSPPVNWNVLGTNTGPIASGKKNESGVFVEGDVVWSIITLAPDRDIGTPMTLALNLSKFDDPQEIFGEPYIALLNQPKSDTKSVTMRILKHEESSVIVEITDPPLTPNSYLLIRTFSRYPVMIDVKCVSCPAK